MSDLGQLRARVTADIAELEQNLGRGEQSLDQFGTAGEKSGRKAGKGMDASTRASKALKVGAAAAAAGAAV